MFDTVYHFEKSVPLLKINQNWEKIIQTKIVVFFASSFFRLIPSRSICLPIKLTTNH